MSRSLLFLLALAAYAQPYEVRGTVTETGAGGISDVEVTIQRVEDGASKSTKTDAQGMFRVTVDSLGIYFATASKPGYTGGGQSLQPITLDSGRPRADVVISLMRAGEVDGRVLDEETREPTAGVRVMLFTKQWNYGRLSLNPAAREPAVTDADGRFRFQGVRPAEYLASARLQSSSVQVLENFTKADLEKTDEGFPATYWPGGGDAASAFATQLTSGGYADVGNLFIRKAPQYRVHVAMQGNCPESETVRVSILKRNGGAAAPLGSVPCSGELLLRGFDPDSYVLYAASERRTGNLDTTVSGVAGFAIVDKNLKIVLPLQRNIVIEGQLTFADGVTAPPILPRIVTRPFDLITGAQVESDTTILWAPDQRHFQLAVSPRTVSLIVNNPPTGAYVQEIRYNGTPVRGFILPLNPSAPSHKLEILLDNKYGSLVATVTDGNRTVADAQVMIVKESARVDDLTAMPPGTAFTAANGTFSTPRLAPGDYRAIAFPRAQQSKIHEAGVLERMLSTAQRITIPAGGTQTVTIRLSDPR